MKHVFPWGRGLFGFIMVLIGLTLVVPPLFGAGPETAYDRDQLAQLIELNNKRVGNLDDQMASIQAEIDWLGLKIQRLIDYGRGVSTEMKRSMKQKRNTLVAVSKERDRLGGLAVEYRATLERLDARLEEEARVVAEAERALAIANAEVALAFAKGEGGKMVSRKLDKAPAPKAKQPLIRESDLSGASAGATIGYEELRRGIKKAGLGDWVDVVGDGTCVRIENQLPILFASGKANLVKEYKVFLKKLARFLKPYDVRIVVDGYADTDPIHTAKYPSNFELGATRAANIVHELVRNGLKPSVFKIGSTGEHRFYAKKTSKRKLFERRAQVSVIFSG